MTTLRVPEAALPEWDRLSRLLIDYQPPCTHKPEQWWSFDPDDIEAAVVGCYRCRVLAECGRYADAAGEPFGVWAGVNREPRHRPKETP